MPVFTKGRYSVRLADGPADIAAAQGLRHLCFHGMAGLDCDEFDEICQHILVEDRRDGALVCVFRLLALPNGGAIGASYSAQYYNLSGLTQFAGPMAEMGRFCIHPAYKDPDILRVAWGALTGIVDRQGVQMLFGCASFHGTEAAQYRDAFAMLRARHVAPKRWLPKVKAPRVFRFSRLAQYLPDAKEAMRRMPPLLRTYLLMGGWVSDHAVVDGQMNTLHVFTGLEIAAIPPARARLLRAVAAVG